jgi:RNA 2',3'-cyclic 3'-phosphodiesterase
LIATSQNAGERGESELTMFSLCSLFFALKPPPHIAEHIHRFSERARAARGLSGPLILSRCYHITVLGAGAYETTSKATLDGLRTAASRVAMRSFHIALDRTMSFAPIASGRSCWPATIASRFGAHMLLRELASALRQVGFRLRTRAFTPHLTLFYSGHDLGEDSIAEIGWTVRDFALIHSVHGQSRHELIGGWRLGAGA